jgi:hypothetical protein
LLLALDGLVHALMLLSFAGMTERQEQWSALLDQSRVSASDERNEQRRYPTDSQWDSA